jgi:hypothetical protein
MLAAYHHLPPYGVVDLCITFVLGGIRRGAFADRQHFLIEE